MFGVFRAETELKLCVSEAFIKESMSKEVNESAREVRKELKERLAWSLLALEAKMRNEVERSKHNERDVIVRMMHQGAELYRRELGLGPMPGLEGPGPFLELQCALCPAENPQYGNRTCGHKALCESCAIKWYGSGEGELFCPLCRTSCDTVFHYFGP